MKKIDYKKYFEKDKGYIEDKCNFMRAILIPMVEYYRLENKEKLQWFLNYLGGDKTFISKYLFDVGLYKKTTHKETNEK